MVIYSYPEAALSVTKVCRSPAEEAADHWAELA